MLDEPTAIVEGYNSYFSFSKKRSGYSGEFEKGPENNLFIQVLYTYITEFMSCQIIKTYTICSKFFL